MFGLIGSAESIGGNMEERRRKAWDKPSARRLPFFAYRTTTKVGLVVVTFRRSYGDDGGRGVAFKEVGRELGGRRRFVREAEWSGRLRKRSAVGSSESKVQCSGAIWTRLKQIMVYVRPVYNVRTNGV
jgi:hypothetical protein